LITGVAARMLSQADAAPLAAIMPMPIQPTASGRRAKTHQPSSVADAIWV